MAVKILFSKKSSGICDLFEKHFIAFYIIRIHRARRTRRIEDQRSFCFRSVTFLTPFTVYAPVHTSPSGWITPAHVLCRLEILKDISQDVFFNVSLFVHIRNEYAP